MKNEDDDNEEVRVSDRRHYGIRELSSTVLLLLNFGGIVWGAATMSGSLKNLRETTDKLSHTLEQTTTKMETIQLDYSSRMAVLENRVSAAERELSDLNQRVRGN